MCSHLVFSQNSVIQLMPNMAQGYVVMSKANKPQIKYWQVSILERKYNELGEAVGDFTVLTKKLENDKNYLKIDPEYLQRVAGKQYFVKVDGFNNGNHKVTNDEPPRVISNSGNENGPADLCSGCVPFVKDCEWKCNSTNHAFSIQRFANYATASGQTSYYNLDYAFDVPYNNTLNTPAIPYYEYLDINGLNTACQQGQNGRFYWLNLGYSCQQSGYNGAYGANGVTLIGPLDGISNAYFNSSGTRIFGDVYGVMKGLGPWQKRNQYDIIESGCTIVTGILNNGGSESCSRPMAQAIDIMNQHADFDKGTIQNYYPTLNCIPDYSQPSGGGISWGSNNCLGTFGGYNENNSAWNDFNANMENLSDCYQDAGFIGDFPSDSGLFIKWPNVNNVIITDLNNPSIKPIILKTTDFFKKPNTNASTNGQTHSNANANWNSGNGSNEGEWSGPNFTLTPSLYSIGIEFTNGKYLPIVKENLTTVTIKYEMKELLDVKATPVPIETNTFGLNMKAIAKLKVTYQLLNSQGTQIHSQVFQLEKDQELTETISPISGIIPTGILLNRFTFEDGSVKTFQTIRN